MRITITVSTAVADHDILLNVHFYKGEKPSWSDWDGGCPGYDPYYEVDKAWLVRGNKKREIDVDDLLERKEIDDLIWEAVDE